MTSRTSFGVVPFVRDEEDVLRPLELLAAENPASANYRASSGVRVGKYHGAIAFLRTGEPRSGFRSTVLGIYGEVPTEFEIDVMKSADGSVLPLPPSDSA